MKSKEYHLNVTPIGKPMESILIDKRGRRLSEEARRLMGGSTRFKPVHGMKKSPEYMVWNSMLSRCKCVGSSSYKNYGAKGIRVCKEWDKFENFFHDMGKRPSNNHSIERVDPYGNYEPNNCKWILTSEQQNNKRNNHFITFNNETLTLSQWARKKGLKIPKRKEVKK